MNLLPKFKEPIMVYFKKFLGYGHRCSNCDRTGKLIEAFVNEFSFDLVKFQCRGCKKCWVIEFKNNEIKNLVS